MNKVLDRYEELKGDQRKLPSAWFDGKDLMNLGFKEGKTIGHLLDKLYDFQLDGRFKDKTDAKNWLKKELRES